MIKQRCPKSLACVGVLSASFLSPSTSAASVPLRIAQLEGEQTMDEQSHNCVALLGTFRMEDIWSEQVELDYRGASLIVRLRHSSDTLNLDGFDRNAPYAELGRFEFQDDTYCTADLVQRGFDLDGTDDAEIVLGTNATDRIRGGAGNDTLDGAGGDDSYLYARGDGVDCIKDLSGRTRVVFQDGISPQDLLLAEHGSAGELALFVRLVPRSANQASDGLNIRVNATASPPLLEFRFADGSALAWNDLRLASKRRPLDESVVALEQECHVDALTAARAGLLDRRSAR